MSDIEGYILAGGAGSRMGQDKGRMILGGETFLDRAARALSAISAGGLFVAAGRAESLTTPLPVIEDQSRGADRDSPAERSAGAIIGLYTALKSSKSEWAAILACDLPFARIDLFQRLAAIDRRGFDAVVPMQDQLTAQPLCGLYRRNGCLPVVGAMLDHGEKSLHALLRRINTRFVRFDEISDLPQAERFFLNVNTPEDYAAAQAALENTS